MKHIFFFLAGICLANGVSAQTILDDAKILSKYFNAPDPDNPNEVSMIRDIPVDAEATAVLKKYMLVEKEEIVRADVAKIFEGESVPNAAGASTFPNKNPFIRIEDGSQNFASLKMMGFAPAQPPPSASGFSVAGFADGVSRFLVKRTKQELSQAFFDDFKKAIEKQELLNHFCPATKKHLSLVDQDVYQFNDYLEGLRETFTTDMTALPGNTESYLRNTELCVGCADEVNGKIMIDFLHLSQQLVDGEPPIDMIEYLASDGAAIQTATTGEPVLFDMANGFQFLHLVSESLRKQDSDDRRMPWHTGREVRELFKDRKLFRLYLGLLWQKADSISFLFPDKTNPNTFAEVKMRAILGKAASGAMEFENWRKSFESLGEATHSLQRSIHANTNTPTSVADDFFRYTQSITSLMQTVNQTGRVMLGRTQNDNIIPETYLQLMQQSNSLYFNVRQRNYTGAISNVIYCLNLFKEQRIAQKDRAVSVAQTALNAATTPKQKDDAEKTLKKAKKEREKVDTELNTLLKYANFVASIAEANSPEEVERAIEMFALPPGSSRMKKQPGRFSVALNAYTGFAWGKEYLGNDQESSEVKALSAPIGVSASWGLGNVGSIGFFVPLIDVGAVTAYRFDDKNTAKLPELTWENIFSPGFYLVYDLPYKLPIALGYGRQLGPGLRKVTEINGNEITKSGWRQGFFASVDIPITFFYLGKGKK